MKGTITERTERAEAKAKVLLEKYGKMKIDELLKYMKENREQYRRERNIINRFNNLFARDNGYVSSEQMMKEN